MDENLISKFNDEELRILTRIIQEEHIREDILWKLSEQELREVIQIHKTYEEEIKQINRRQAQNVFKMILEVLKFICITIFDVFWTGVKLLVSFMGG